MTDIKKFSGDVLSPETYKEHILKLERENLRDLDKKDKKQMVSLIVKHFEEARKNDHK